MTSLSPLDALGPAFRRTREVLAQPFRLGFFLKIALVAALTQPSFYSMSLSYPTQGAQFAVLPHLGGRSSFGESSFADHFLTAPRLAVFGAAALVVGVLFALAVWIVLAYLYCRLRFTLFDLVVFKRGRVRQAWSEYGHPAWRYFGLVILVSLAFMVVAALILGPVVLNLVRVMRPLIAAGTNANPFPVLGAMLPLIAAIFGVVALWAVIDALMQDFLLPPMAIEDAPLESAFARFFTLLKNSFGSVVLYVLLRFAVGIGLNWILLLIVFVGLLIAGLAIFGVGFLLYHALWASVLGQVVCVALAIVVGFAVIVVYLAAMVSVFGISAVFKQSYAVYFFGGRYSALGIRLEPPPTLASVDLIPPMPANEPPTDLFPSGDTPAVW
ncbi:hypothetical protein ACPOL_4903 [Acidisarcina polymorpha]|uniref:Uncharacterized protein n=1 Tax=Acidisarcina polymorpha TaxID=2211140 RepID=A0A2Z5G6A7_9BACT|nr:hypothetical protein [Acidisarcina polymorpha]AXC14165.1 hypothetical protein ACPOL_4903 [Acidisarcina polymorpha]